MKVFMINICFSGNEGGYYQPTAQMLESENDRMENELSSKVKALKSVNIIKEYCISINRFNCIKSFCLRNL